MKFLIPILFLAFFACSKEKQQATNQETQEKKKTEVIKDQPKKFDKEVAVAHIRELFGKINEQAKSAEVMKKDLMEESTEGGQLKAFKNNGKIIKVILFAFGETGRATKEYYFENEKLIFAFSKDEYYDRPMYVEGAKISKSEENRYYFYNEKLFKWLDPSKNEVDIKTAHEAEEEIINSSREYLKLFASE